MHWQKEQVESFFGAKFALFDPLQGAPVQEMRFESGGLLYRLWHDEQDGMLILTADVLDPDCPFPALEVSFECRRIEEAEATAVGPVLLMYASSDKREEHLRLAITRDREGRFSICPCWQLHEKDT